MQSYHVVLLDESDNSPKSEYVLDCRNATFVRSSLMAYLWSTGKFKESAFSGNVKRHSRNLYSFRFSALLELRDEDSFRYQRLNYKASFRQLTKMMGVAQIK